MSLYGDLLNEGACSEQRLVTAARAGARATVTLEEPARLNVLSAPLVLQTKQDVHRRRQWPRGRRRAGLGARLRHHRRVRRGRARARLRRPRPAPGSRHQLGAHAPARLPGAFAFFVEDRDVSAAQALELGLVQELVAPDELEAAVERWCDPVIGVPSHAVAMAKPLLRAAADAGWETALTMEEFAEPNCFTTAPFHAAVRARLEDSSS